jgi:adhesin/invasin
VNGARPHQRSWHSPRQLGLAGLLAGSLLAASSAGAVEGEPCPPTNRPDTLVVVAGSPQTTQLGKPFQTNLQVALANTNGCPLTGPLGGYAVRFAAPSTAASGTFAGSGTSAATVGTDGTGNATAPTFTANDNSGSYTVLAQSDFGTATLSLTNTASGLASSIGAVGTSSAAATVNRRFQSPLRARVQDANGAPVQGVTVTFSLSTATNEPGASFAGASNQATAETDASGIATSPELTANSTSGSFDAYATVAGVSTSARYRLRNLAGRPATIKAGVADGQSTAVGRLFPIRLAVTVKDDDGNPVPNVTVTFTAPARGASGTFRTRSGRRRTAHARTDAKGLAIAPAFTAGRRSGGYAVIARAGRRRAAFALINTPR